MQLNTLRHRFALVTAILIAMFVSMSSQAQSVNQQLITVRNGDLWQFDIENNTASQLTQWGYNGGPIMSPDGLKIAYLSTATEIIDMVNRGEQVPFAGTSPGNIWVMDIATGDFTQIVNQSGSGDVGFLRSIPSWSPDSTKLVWSQLNPVNQGLDQATLQIHDLQSGLTTTLAQNYHMGFQDGGIWMPPVKWGAGGIARTLFTYQEGSRDPFLFMEIYNPLNGNLTRYDLGFDSNNNNYVRDYMWVTHQGRSMIALGIQNYWELFDPTNGSRSRLSAPPRLKNRFISGGLELIPVSISDNNGGWSIQWQVVLNNVEYNTGYISYAAGIEFTPSISYDGSKIAWHNGDSVSTWEVGTGQTGRTSGNNQSLVTNHLMPQPNTVAWSPTEWVTSSTSVVIQPTPTSPPSSNVCNLAPRLVVGQNAVVNPGPSNRLRVGATINSAVITSIDAGEVVFVQQGPICANGYYWYYVRNSRVSGWTAEGGNGEYWLSVDVNSVYCFNSPPARLAPNTLAKVLPGVPNNIRSNIGTEGTQILGVMPAGATFTITGTGQCDSQGLRWYPISYNGVSGWTAEGQGSEYWIGPA